MTKVSSRGSPKIASELLRTRILSESNRSGEGQPPETSEGQIGAAPPSSELSEELR